MSPARVHECVHEKGAHMKAKITKSLIDGMTPGDVIADSDTRGFTARCLPSGAISYGVRYRAAGRQRWLALGTHGQITPAQARQLANKRIGEVADSRDPAAEREAQRAKASCTVNTILDSFIERHVRHLRTARQVERAFDKYVRPHLGARSIYSLKRGDIVGLLDDIEDQHGARQADAVLAYLRKGFNWWSTRDENFLSPVIRGMGRTNGSQRARSRILADVELRDLGRALDAAKVAEPFPRLVRTLLLTGQRRSEVAQTQWSEIDGNVWSMGERRGKGGAHSVPLTDAVLRLLGPPRRDGYVFSTTGGRKAFGGFSKSKAALDDAIAEVRKAERRAPMPDWRLHDLRRTARSLMSRAGVDADHAERVLGHAIPGVRGVYDRHSYLEEKRVALERLATLVERILNPGSNVVALKRIPPR